MLDPDRYFTNDINFLKTRYIDVVCQIASLRRYQHDSVVAERKARFHLYGTFIPAPGVRDSFAARERFADAGTLSEWLTLRDYEWQLQDYLEERELLLHLIEWQNSGVR